MTEVPTQAVNGLTINGVTFHFTVNGAASTDAFYNAADGGIETYVQDPSLEGTSTGVLTMDFALPTQGLQFGVSRNVTGPLSPGLRVDLYDGTLNPIGASTINTSVSVTYSEGLYTSNLTIGRAVVTFPNSVSAPRFAIDNINFTRCQVVKTDTTISLTSAPNPSNFGDAVTITATVTPSEATGVVTIFDGGIPLGGAVNLSGGVATLVVSSATTGNFGVGSHQLTASYSGDNLYNASSTGIARGVVQVVNSGKPAPTVTLTATPNPSTAGQAVSLKATLSPTTPTGTVTFKDGTTTVGTANVSGGSASLAVTTLAQGIRTLTATYNGDANFSAATSAPITQTVNAAAMTITSLNPSTAAAGGGDFPLTINGTGFSQGAQAQWNGTALATSVGSPTQATATVSASLIASAGAAAVRMVNGSSLSNSVTFTVNPPGQSCNFTFSPASVSIGSAGGQTNTIVTASRSDCIWNGTANVPWITFPNGSVTGNGSLVFNVSANPGGTSRTGKVTVGLQSFTVTQGGTACTFSLPASSKSFGAGGGDGTASVQAPPGCFWTSNNGGSSFVAITPPGVGSGNGFINFTVAANPTPTTRTATLTVAGKPFTVVQAAAGSTVSCTAAATSVPVVAFEGLTEAAGGITVVCNGVSGAIKGDVVLSLNTPATNPLNGVLNPLLSVNGGPATAGTIAGFNVIRFNGQTLNPSNGTVTLAISQIYVNANYLGTINNNPALPIIGQVSIASLAPVPISPASVTIATSARALNFSKGQAAPPTGGARLLVPAVFSEAQAAGFQANSSRLRALLTNVPATVQVFAPVFPTEGNTRARLFSADSNGAGGAAVNGTQVQEGLYQQLTVSGGTATATWLVLAADNATAETWTFPILLLNATASDLNAIQMGGSLAPVSTVNVSSVTAPLPRYRDTSVPTALVNLRLTSSVTLQPGTPAAPSLGMHVQAAIAPRAADVGGRVTFTNTIVNDTSDPNQTATNVVIKDNLPTGLTLISCTAPGATCGGSGNQVEVTIGTMGPGQTNTVTITAQIDPNLANGSVLENQVSASSDQVNQDLDAANSSSSFVVVNGAPVAVGQTPASGSGSTQNFVFTFSHPSGFQQLGVVNVLINNFLDGRNACYLAYAIQQQSLFLIDDQGHAGGPFAGTAQLGSQTPIQNSQCSVVLAGALGSGNNLTLTLGVTFKPAFGGNKIVFVAARDQANANTDWQALGVWQVPFGSPGAIAVTGVEPGRSAGAAGTSKQFRFTLTDSKGTGDLGIVNVLVNNFIDGRRACYLAYNTVNNNLILVNDAGDAGGPFAGTMVLNGPSASVENSQCLVSTAGSTVSFGAGTMTLTLNITFKPAFAGNKVLYIAARDRQDGSNTDWQALGTYSVQ